MKKQLRRGSRHNRKLAGPKRFRAKACPGLDPGWISVRVRKTSTKSLEFRRGALRRWVALVLFRHQRFAVDRGRADDALEVQ